ncbi:MAG: alpha/beta hydrolase [Cytophagales bacterium]
METIELHHKANTFKACLFENKSAKASVLICPAMGITAKYYVHLATWISEQGYSVMVLDYQGTGLSGSKREKNNNVTLQDWIKNIEITGQWLKMKNPKTTLIFVGHSIGSQLFGFIEEIQLFDKAIFIASSTGYWKDGHSPQKWINYFLLNIILPLSNLIWGYTNAKFFGQGENYPKKVALKWRKWCINKDYLKIELNDEQKNNFNHFDGKITSLWFSDDNVANEITAPKLVALYKKAVVELVEIKPEDCKTNKIGHSGFLSRKFKETLWRKFLDAHLRSVSSQTEK